MDQQYSTWDSALVALARLRAFAVLLCLDRELADELLCVTLIRSAVAMPSLDANRSPWLFRKLRGYFYNDGYARRSRVKAPGYADSASSEPSEAPAPDGDVLWRALAKLPPQERELIVLVDAMGLTLGHAAGITNLPKDRIIALLARARRDVNWHLMRKRAAGSESSRRQFALAASANL